MRRGWLNRFRRAEQILPYTSLAFVYDRLMDHVDYEGWAAYVRKIFEKFGCRVHRIVDGGCGTGTLLRVLEKRGFFVVGFDRSLEMIRMARRKTQSPLWQGDLNGLSLRGEWDAFLCLYDSIQYLTREEIILFFSAVKSILREGGLFIFDVVTQKHVLKYWAHYTERLSGDEWDTVRRSWYNRKGRCLHTEIESLSHRNRKVYTEHHLQWIFRLDEWRHYAERGGFHLTGGFDGYTLNAGSEESDRVHFVLRRKAR
ncbi:MAG: class I SAM-dependent methyltransferase [bacterium]